MLPKIQSSRSADILKELLVAWVGYADLLMQLVLQSDMMCFQIRSSIDQLTECPVHILRHGIRQLIQFIDSYSCYALSIIAVILFVLRYTLSVSIG